MEQAQEDQADPMSPLEALPDYALDHVLISFMCASGGEQAALAAHRHWRLVCRRMAASAGHAAVWQHLVYELFHAHLVVAAPDVGRSAAQQSACVHRSALLQFPLPVSEPGTARQPVQNDYHLLFRVLAQITPQPAASTGEAPAPTPYQPAGRFPMLPAPLPAVGQAPAAAPTAAAAAAPAAQPAGSCRRQQSMDSARVAAEDCPPEAKRLYYELCLANALNAGDAADARTWLGALQVGRLPAGDVGA